MKTRPGVEAQDLYVLEQASGVRISQSGLFVVYSQKWVERKTEKKYSNLWVVSTAGGAPKRFTSGQHTDHSPAWSPDSKRIAFLSNRKDEKQFQICLIPIDGGEAQPLTDVKGDFGSLTYSADGTRILCMFRKRDTEVIEREKDEQKKKLGVVSRRITRTFFKLDGEGYLPLERWHIWVFNARTGRGTQLTDGECWEDRDPAWSPDGKSIVFVSNRSVEPDLDPESDDLYVVNASTKRVRALGLPLGGKRFPTLSPDGKRVAYIASVGRGDWWQNAKLLVAPFRGKGVPRDLTGRFDVDANNFTINDLGNFDHSAPVWSNDGERIYLQIARHGNTTLHSVETENSGARLAPVIAMPGVTEFFTFDAEQSKLAYFHSDLLDTGQVRIQTTDGSGGGPLTRINESWFRKKTLGEIEEVWFKGGDGNDLQGWILKPPGFREGRKYPAILEIHGGPMAQYGNLFMHEFHYLSAGEYVVCWCNPRGGMGYGEEHAKAIENAWGTKDYEDLMRWTDFVARKPYVDAKRLGVTGGSYGGFMTCWIVGHTHRFKAAVTQRCVSNLISMYGSSDFNWMFQREFGDRPVWEDIDNYWRQSPMKHAGKIKTPTLVIHNEQDMRCDIEQGEQFYVALKKSGVPSEFLRFPEEFHGLSRGGRTDRRVIRLEAIRGWFDRWLK